jgi:hypothetical protein
MHLKIKIIKPMLIALGQITFFLLVHVYIEMTLFGLLTESAIALIAN